MIQEILTRIIHKPKQHSQFRHSDRNFLAKNKSIIITCDKVTVFQVNYIYINNLHFINSHTKQDKSSPWIVIFPLPYFHYVVIIFELKPQDIQTFKGWFNATK